MSDNERIEKAHDIALQLMDALPKRIWVEGDGKIYGDFGNRQRHRINELEAIKLIHMAAEKANVIFSI